MASSSTAATLSWSSSSWLHTFGSSFNDTVKLPEKKSVFLVLAQKKAKKTRKITLKGDVDNLGKKGQLLDVKAGEMKMEEERIEAEKQRVKEEEQRLARMFETVGAFKVKRKGGKGKLIFGSVTAQDLVDIIKAQLQREVDKRIVSLPESVKQENILQN